MRDTPRNGGCPCAVRGDRATAAYRSADQQEARRDGLWLIARERFSVAANVVTWAGLAALNTAVLSLMLHGTKFYLGGISSDQSFRAEDVTRWPIRPGPPTSPSFTCLPTIRRVGLEDPGRHHDH
ncbi:MAG: arabinofuranosyltransferase [Pseudonocardiaceae bacterium]